MASTSKNYVLGSGEVYLAHLDPTTKLPVEGERYIGNTSAFGINVQSQMLDHYDADHGVRTLDQTALLQVTRNGTLTTDQIDPNTVADFFMGTTGTLTQASATGQTDSFASIVQDRWYQLGTTTANPSGVRNVTNVVLNVAGVPLVEGTDYEIDLTYARFRILPGSTAAAAGATVDATYDVSASTREQTISGNSAVYVALRFIATNSIGVKRDYYLPYCQISPNGEYQLKGDQWQQMQFNLSVLQRDTTTAAIYIDGQAA